MNNITIENLKNKDFFKELFEHVNKIEFHYDTNEALKVFLGLKKNFWGNEKEIGVDLAEGYREIINRLKFILFTSISNEEVLRLFKKHLVVGIKMIYVDLLEVLKVRISFLPLPDRDEYKKQIIIIILENQEKITRENIDLNGKKVGSTISSWLKDYNSVLGTGARSNLEQSKYFIRNRNFTKLSDLEKLELKELFSIYEYLKRSSMTLEGNEDDEIIEGLDGKTYILKDGKIVDESFYKGKKEVGSKKLSIPKTQEERNLEELKEMLNQYPAGSLERKVVEEEIAKLESGKL